MRKLLVFTALVVLALTIIDRWGEMRRDRKRERVGVHVPSLAQERVSSDVSTAVLYPTGERQAAENWSNELPA